MGPPFAQIANISCGSRFASKVVSIIIVSEAWLKLVLVFGAALSCRCRSARPLALSDRASVGDTASEDDSTFTLGTMSAGFAFAAGGRFTLPARFRRGWHCVLLLGTLRVGFSICFCSSGRRLQRRLFLTEYGVLLELLHAAPRPQVGC